MRLRLSGGELKGRFIKTIVTSGLRPTTDATRQALFNMLGDKVLEARILDLYAGTGSFGFEALSRGANTVTFVEENRNLTLLLKDNSKELGVDSSTVIVNKSVEKIKLEEFEVNSFEIIFADPPYSLFPLPNIGIISSVLVNSGLFVYEHSRRQEVPEQLDCLTREKLRTSGDTAISIYRKNGN